MKITEAFKNLSKRVGIQSVGWRYDPIFISNDYPVERHMCDFEQMASSLAGYTNTCGHLCRYCYANYDKRTVLRNMKQHNPKSPLLLGHFALYLTGFFTQVPVMEDYLKENHLLQ